MGKGGLEPPRLAAPDPKSGPSASSGTPPHSTPDINHVTKEANQFYTTRIPCFNKTRHFQVYDSTLSKMPQQSYNISVWDSSIRPNELAGIKTCVYTERLPITIAANLHRTDTNVKHIIRLGGWKARKWSSDIAGQQSSGIAQSIITASNAGIDNGTFERYKIINNNWHLSRFRGKRRFLI